MSFLPDRFSILNTPHAWYVVESVNFTNSLILQVYVETEAWEEAFTLSQLTPELGSKVSRNPKYQYLSIYLSIYIYVDG